MVSLSVAFLKSCIDRFAAFRETPFAFMVGGCDTCSEREGYKGKGAESM